MPHRWRGEHQLVAGVAQCVVQSEYARRGCAAHRTTHAELEALLAGESPGEDDGVAPHGESVVGRLFEEARHLLAPRLSGRVMALQSDRFERIARQPQQPLAGFAARQLELQGRDDFPHGTTRHRHPLAVGTPILDLDCDRDFLRQRCVRLGHPEHGDAQHQHRCQQHDRRQQSVQQQAHASPGSWARPPRGAWRTEGSSLRLAASLALRIHSPLQED